MSISTIPSLEELVGRWDIDVVHSSLNFAARHMMISTVRGAFREFTAWFVVGETDSEFAAECSIQVASIETGNRERDDDLRATSFLDAEAFPVIQYRADDTDLGHAADGRARVRGDLVIKGVSRPVELDVTFKGFAPHDESGLARLSLTATTQIDRREFGMTWNRVLDSGGILVGNEVAIELEITALRKTQGS